MEFLSTLCFIIITILVLVLIYDLMSYRERSKVSLKNKHVVVTGGSSGIGKSFACEVAKRGANVTLVARDTDKLKAAETEVKECCVLPTQKVSSSSVDVCGSYESIEESFKKIEEDGGPIFMLTNCAGMAVCGILEDTNPSDVLKMINLNCVGSIFTTKAVVKGMKARGEGHIIFTSSEAAFLGVYGLSSYSASKFALRGFAEALQMEVKLDGVQVTIAFPPDTDTPGFIEEEKSKPKETSLICQTAGLYKPEQVASMILNDALAGCFSSVIGFEGFMLQMLNVGMSEENSFWRPIAQVFMMGFVRTIALFYNSSFYSIISKCRRERNERRKAE